MHLTSRREISDTPSNVTGGEKILPVKLMKPEGSAETSSDPLLSWVGSGHETSMQLNNSAHCHCS